MLFHLIAPPRNLTNKINPSYPALAKAAHIEGNVKLEVVISKTGIVDSVKVLRGHPMLVPSAIQAVKQWRYKPFIVDGRAAAIRTEIEIPFSMGVAEADYKKEQEATDTYFKEDEKCRGLIKAKQYVDAEPSCRTAVELVEKLPPERRNERRMAYELLGHSLFFQRKFGDALIPYQQELAIAQRSLQPHEAELGYAYHDMALGLHATGDLKEARSNYELAEKTLEEAYAHIDSEFLKNKYSATLKSVLRDYALLLRQSGDIAAADAAEQKANSIAVRTDLENP